MILCIGWWLRLLLQRRSPRQRRASHKEGRPVVREARFTRFSPIHEPVAVSKGLRLLSVA